jgi:hypothetical protein
VDIFDVIEVINKFLVKKTPKRMTKLVLEEIKNYKKLF